MNVKADLKLIPKALNPNLPTRLCRHALNSIEPHPLQHSRTASSANQLLKKLIVSKKLKQLESVSLTCGDPSASHASLGERGKQLLKRLANESEMPRFPEFQKREARTVALLHGEAETRGVIWYIWRREAVFLGGDL
jgi:hypothetical protein